MRKHLLEEVRRGEISHDEAPFAARLLQASDVELLPTRALLELATRIAMDLDHPSYDCVYIALAIDRDCRFVTADSRFFRKLGEGHRRRFRDRVISLADAAGGAS